ncbi:hypothetical protein F1559_001927 [Cyanidiococcus yangmingshanensis]|uniref:Zinc transporter n=1 Tax=Cyanidiococcus yangmingshanensis TaxID=2690220 RepID=A0A7J7ICQ6_9RHOD|nr:hypothetical protein F1559_001927 [Cyanidiococcus yangmingshanensis]
MIYFICAQILLFALAFLGVLVPSYGGGWRLERGAEALARSREPPVEQGCASQAQATIVDGQRESRENLWVLDVQEWGRGIAAGVLLSAALVHILPSSTLQLKEGLAAVRGSDLETALTVLGTSILVGILGVYSLDLQVRRYSRNSEDNFSTKEESKEADGHAIPLLVGSHRAEPSSVSVGAWPLPDQTRSLQPSAYQDSNCLVSDGRQYATESLIWRVLLCSLSFHALSEGFALGLSQSNIFLMLYLAIIFHKFFAGFALGVSIACADVPFRRQLGCCSAFCCRNSLRCYLGETPCQFRPIK